MNSSKAAVPAAGTASAAASVDAAAAIELIGLSKVYGSGDDANVAVRDVTLSVEPGQVFGFLGPNGAGKTTTIKMICGLISSTSGEIRVNGHSIAKDRSRAVRQIGAVLEGSRNVYWSMSAMQNLMYFGRLKGVSGKVVRPRAERLLSELGLEDVRDKLVGGFSRGMQQKVAVAAALITEPPVVLLDEPTIGLDVEAGRVVKEWIVRLAQNGATVLLTTHQLELAQELSDRVAVIREGVIAADLATTELLDRYAEDRFEIRLAGEPSLAEVAMPEDVQVHSGDEVTRVVLPSANDEDLYRALGELRRSGARLLSIDQVRPDLEEVFMRIVREG